MTFRRFGAVLIAAWIAVLFGCSEQASEVPPVTTAESPPAAAAETPGGQRAGVRTSRGRHHAGGTAEHRPDPR